MFIRRILVFIVQFATVTALVMGGCIAYTLNDRGRSYAETHAFQADLVLYAKVGMATAAVFCLVLFCYHFTRKELQATPDRNDDGWRF